jgi:hypothetical protein
MLSLRSCRTGIRMTRAANARAVVVRTSMDIRTPQNVRRRRTVVRTIMAAHTLLLQNSQLLRKTRGLATTARSAVIKLKPRCRLLSCRSVWFALPVNISPISALRRSTL